MDLNYHIDEDFAVFEVLLLLHWLIGNGNRIKNPE